MHQDPGTGIHPPQKQLHEEPLEHHGLCGCRVWVRRTFIWATIVVLLPFPVGKVCTYKSEVASCPTYHLWNSLQNFPATFLFRTSTAYFSFMATKIPVPPPSSILWFLPLHWLFQFFTFSFYNHQKLLTHFDERRAGWLEVCWNIYEKKGSNLPTKNMCLHNNIEKGRGKSPLVGIAVTFCFSIK